MKYVSVFFLFAVSAFSTQAKSWRVNNNSGVVADFSTIVAANSSASVLPGDTLYIEPSATEYVTSSLTLTKRLIFIGPGYFLDPASTTSPGNAGLQASTLDAKIGFIYLGSAASGTKFLGVTENSSFYFTGATNIRFEKVLFQGGVYFQSGTNDSISFRKCFFNAVGMYGTTSVVLTNFVFENNLFYSYAYVTLPLLSGSGNIFRNNSIINDAYGFSLSNTYVANNIFGTNTESTFSNCTIKNNIFQVAQTLPVTASGNLVSQAMTNVYVSSTTGSLDSRMMLKSGSIASGFGLTIGSVTSPDAGAFGATDPYKLSGIPNVPSIYSLTVPTSIPSGSATMSITLSTRNNN